MKTKTKTILLMINILFFLIVFAGCDKENSGEKIQLKDFSYSGCKENTDVVSRSGHLTRSTGANQEEYIEYEATADGCLNIKHVNATFNCCPDTIKTTISSDRGEIKIIETETGAICNCICSYDLEYKIGPFTNQKYTLILYRDTREYARLTINYTQSLNNTFIIKK